MEYVRYLFSRMSAGSWRRNGVDSSQRTGLGRTCGCWNVWLVNIWSSYDLWMLLLTGHCVISLYFLICPFLSFFLFPLLLPWLFAAAVPNYGPYGRYCPVCFTYLAIYYCSFTYCLTYLLPCWSSCCIRPTANCTSNNIYINF